MGPNLTLDVTLELSDDLIGKSGMLTTIFNKKY
jgi:hypothetical protein